MIGFRTQEIFFKYLSAGVDPLPGGRHPRMTGIAVPEQKLQLVNGQGGRAATAFLRPPLKRPPGQTLLTKPEPLVNALMAVPRLFRKTKTQPEKGSASRICRQIPASPSIPFLKSTALTERRIRICGVIWIIAPVPKTLSSTPKDQDIAGL
jgi:hypothetical protein